MAKAEYYKVINQATKHEVFRSKSHKCCMGYIQLANAKWKTAAGKVIASFALKEHEGTAVKEHA